MPTHYDVLNVAPAADDLVIEAAYRALLKRHHPDVNPTDDERAEATTRDIIAAYQVLRDPTARAEYDRELARARETREEPVSEAHATSSAHPAQPVAASPRKSSSASWFFIALACLVLFSGLRSLAGLGGTKAIPSPTASEPAAGAASATGGAGQTGVLINWSESDTPGVAHYAIDGLDLSLEGRDVSEGRETVLTVRGPAGAPPYEVTAPPGLGSAMAEIGVGRIDPASPTPQVLFTTFSGGAHCCADIRLIERLKGAWRTTEVAVQDGDRLGAFPVDLDGDGAPEFKLIDGSFLYAFASYAESLAPPRIVSVQAGRVKDVSAEPRFSSVFESYLPEAQRACEQHNNGACAAFAAAAARAGQLDHAWSIVLTNYNAQSDWDLPYACKVAVADASCPDDKQLKFETYPEALRWFLGDQGYISAVYMPLEGDTGPSFDCGRANTPTLKLVCSTPDLGEADREMAVAYNRALALSTNPSALRDSQRRFLSDRAAAPLDVDALLQLYAARILALQ